MHEPPTVADLLRRSLDALGITQTELAHACGLTTKHVNQIMQNHQVITPKVAILIGRATGIPAQVWAGMQAARLDWELSELMDEILPEPVRPALLQQRNVARAEAARLQDLLLRNGA